MLLNIDAGWIEKRLNDGFSRDDLKAILLSSDAEADLLYSAARASPRSAAALVIFPLFLPMAFRI